MVFGLFKVSPDIDVVLNYSIVERKRQDLNLHGCYTTSLAVRPNYQFWHASNGGESET